MAYYELKLRHDYEILRRVRNLNWDLQNLRSGFIIQLQINNIVQVQHTQISPGLRVTNSRPEKFLYKDRGHFLSFHGMGQFLSNILAAEGATVDTNGRFLCHNGLQLICPEASGPLRFPHSLRIYTLKKLVECALMYFRWMSHSPSNHFPKFVPIAMDLAMVTTRQFQFQRVDDTVTLGSAESLQFNKFNTEAPVRLAEERIQCSCSEENCSICLERLGFGQLAARTPCAHIFHKKCIARWLLKNRSCPLCRAPADAEGSSLPIVSIS